MIAVQDISHSRAQRFVESAWRTMGREADLPLADIATAGINTLMETSDKHYFLRERTGLLHRKLTSQGTTDKDLACSKFSPTVQVNNTVIFLATSAATIAVKETDPQNTNHDLHKNLRWGIQSSWQNRTLGKNNCLAWDETTDLLLLGIGKYLKENNIKFNNLGEPKDFKDLCEFTHELMTSTNYVSPDTGAISPEVSFWGKDNDNYRGVKFDDLPSHMKENYVLLILTAFDEINKFSILGKVEDIDGYLKDHAEYLDISEKLRKIISKSTNIWFHYVTPDRPLSWVLCFLKGEKPTKALAKIISNEMGIKVNKEELTRANNIEGITQLLIEKRKLQATKTD